MKIVHVLHRYYPNLGGVEDVVKKIAEFQAKNNEVTVITGDYVKGLKKKETINRVKIIRFKSFSPYNKYFYCNDVFSIMKSIEADIVHIHSLSNILSYQAFNGVLKNKKKIKIVLTPYHHTFSSITFNDFLHKILFPLKKKIMNRCDNIIALTSKEKKILIEKYGINPEKISVIPPIIESPSKSMEKYVNNNNKLFRILYVGRLEKYKRVQDVIWALSKLKDFNVEFNIIGNGQYKKKLQRLAKKYKLVNVNFLGNIRDIEHYYKKANLFVNLSVYESFGITIFQALSYHIPVLISNLPVSDLIGRCFCCKNKDEFFEKLKRMIINKKYYYLMRNKTKSINFHQFSINKLNKQILSVYRCKKKLNVHMLLRFIYPKDTFWCSQIIALSKYLNLDHKIEWTTDSYSNVCNAVYKSINLNLMRISKSLYLRPFSELINFFKKFALLRKKIKNNKLDILYVRNDVLNGLIAVLLKKIYHVKFVYSMSYPINDSLIFESKLRDRNRIFKLALGIFGKLFENLIIKNSDLAVAISEKMRKKYFGKHKNSYVFPMGYDFETRFKKTSLQKGYKYILYHGSLDRTRQLDFLLKCFLRLKKKNGHRLKLLITGDGNDKSFLKKKIKEFGLHNDIILYGKVTREQFRTICHKCVIGLSPIPPNKIFEVSSPSKVVEYLANRIPVVSTKIEDSMFIERIGCGRIVDHNVESFTDSINHLLSSDLKKLGNIGYFYVKKNRNYKNMCEQFIRRLELL